MLEKGFVYLDETVPNVKWKAVYYFNDNFTGCRVPMYNANKIVGTNELSMALCSLARVIEKEGLGFFLWDAYRPRSSVLSFLQWVERDEDYKTKASHYPNIEKKNLIDGYIGKRSNHSHGSTVDLTLYRLDTGELLEMGSSFDFMDPVSQHDAKGISERATENRNYLRRLMTENGFYSYSGEWWHYELLNQPYKDIFFDFPVE